MILLLFFENNVDGGMNMNCDPKKMNIYKSILCIALAFFVCLFVVIFELAFYRQIPNYLYVRENELTEVEFSLPVSTKIDDPINVIETLGGQNGRIISKNMKSEKDFANPGDSFLWHIKLFGFIPLKDIDIHVVKEECVYPVGCPVGIYVKSNGVLVAGLGNVETVSHTTVCPCDHILQCGDYITEVDGNEVNLKGEVIDRINQSNGNPVTFTIRRNGEISQVSVTPERNAEGKYQIGAWIRDSAQGIGTLTYVNESGDFGALGHGINDIDTAKLLEIDYGGLYVTEILSTKKGETGKPGEISGIIRFSDSSKIGRVNENTKNGIYGSQIDKSMIEGYENAMSYKVALKQEIEKGPAQIICMEDGKQQFYNIEIENVDYAQSDNNRGLVLKVTDEKLIDKTGGIIQGMSGSPIVQNGKMIGAVTHVFVNDPTKGYGIFAETMLNYN